MQSIHARIRLNTGPATITDILGPTIFGKQFGETKFSLKLLPFGGACMMGEDDVDDMSEGSFNSKSVWARMSVIVAGPVFNLILAWILCMIIIDWKKSG